MSTEESANSKRQRPAGVSPGRPPQAALAARMRHLMSVACDEFVTQGFSEARISRIAQDAGVSKKTIYARFPTKDALLVAVVEDLAARTCTAMLDAKTTMTGEPEEVLTRFAMHIARDWMTPRGVAIYRLVIGEVDRLPQLAEIPKTAMGVMRSTLETYLRGQVRAGRLAIPDPEVACGQFRMLTYGELGERMLLGETITEEEIAATIERAVKLFLDGYAVEKRGAGEGERKS
ncbi:TetR/AcrR family transcriptional regulator [Streptomyces sp. NPDC014892]|uniref:TetR/AcrR family transcriptional regulator n=1 Tax=Streptomyces TaxID=1883 RepID=UPI001EFA81CA|nr:TetR/AcrR family transcriptional regulator [Streptomyces deccanensis]ULR54429.1 TetR/AcrR family transcriptional regulator [Streptomyces deccanensis]